MYDRQNSRLYIINFSVYIILYYTSQYAITIAEFETCNLLIELVINWSFYFMHLLIRFLVKNIYYKKTYYHQH